MWEKETNYKLSLKKNLIYEFVHETYKEQNSTNYDVVFITKENCHLQAHRVILAISSDLIKNFDVPVIDCVIKLPDYRTEVVMSFIKFVYTGETLMDIEYQNEFLSLCKEMMVNIPGLCADNFDVDDEETNEAQEDQKSFMYVEKEEFIEPEELIDEEVETKSSVVCVNQIECDHIRPDPHDEDAAQEKPSQTISIECHKSTAKTKPGLTSPSIDVNFVEKSGCYKSGSLAKESFQGENLHNAIYAVMNDGLSTLKAARLYGIPKTTLYRKMSQMKK